MLSNLGYLRLSFDMIHRDVYALMEYVEPCDDNLATYSHAIYTLFIRCCTEIEAIFKQVARIGNYTSITNKSRPTILDYRQMEVMHLGFEDRVIGVHFWRSHIKYFEPFKDWTRSTPPVAWYQAYNQVKHDREANFAQANLENLMLAFCGLFQAVIQTNILPTSEKWDHYVDYSSGSSEAVFPKYQLSQQDRRDPVPR